MQTVDLETGIPPFLCFPIEKVRQPHRRTYSGIGDISLKLNSFTLSTAARQQISSLPEAVAAGLPRDRLERLQAM